MAEVEFNVKEKEIWKDCTYPGVKENAYKISSKGRVYSNLKEKLLKPQKNWNGYLDIKLLTDNEDIKGFRVHRLVCWEFCDGYDEDSGRTYVNHKNSIRDDPRASNLEWVTASENMAYSYTENGFREAKRGEDAPSAVYTEKQIRKVCKMLEEGKSFKKISEKTGVHMSVINNVACGDTWKEISKDYNIKKRYASYNDEQIEDACVMLENGVDRKTIREKTGLKKSALEQLAAKRLRTDISQNYDLPPTSPTKYTAEQIHEVCRLLCKKVKHADIETMTGVAVGEVNMISQKKHWKDIVSQYDFELKDPHIKYSEDQIREICRLLEEGRLSRKEIADRVGVKKGLVNDIGCHKAWTSISKEYNLPSGAKKTVYTDDQIIKACELLDKGVGRREIADKTGLSFSAVNDIGSGKAHSEISKNYSFMQKKLKNKK